MLARVTTKMVDVDQAGWFNAAVSKRSGRMHVDQAGRHYTTAGGEVRAYPTYLLRRSFRDEHGRPRKETLANLTGLPEESIAALRATLRGRTLVDAEASFEVCRSVPHGNVAAVHVMASELGLRALLGPACPERDIAYALIISRAVRPESKLSTARWWQAGDTTLGTDLGVASAGTDDIYAGMDWLTARQRDIEKKLAARHLRPGGIAMFDLSSSWVEGSCCELAAFGHSRDGKRGRRQVEYGLLTDPEGRPVAVEVFPGNTSDPESFKTAITRVRGDFGIERLIMVGDRGMITGTRIADLRKCEGMEWITALKAPAIAKLARDDGPLQMSLFDTQNFAEITHPDYPGERLVCCHNPVLAAERARKREDLLTATEAELAKISKAAAAGRLKDPDKIGMRIGKVINKRKVGKHFITEVTDGSFTWRRDQDKIAAEAALDGIYVIRTSVPGGILGAAAVISAYKDLKYVERDFRITKADDLAHTWSRRRRLQDDREPYELPPAAPGGADPPVIGHPAHDEQAAAVRAARGRGLPWRRVPGPGIGHLHPERAPGHLDAHLELGPRVLDRVHRQLGHHHRDGVAQVGPDLTDRAQDEAPRGAGRPGLRGEGADRLHRVIRSVSSRPVSSMSRRTIGEGARSSTSGTCWATDSNSAMPELSMNSRPLVSNTTRCGARRSTPSMAARTSSALVMSSSPASRITGVPSSSLISSSVAACPAGFRSAISVPSVRYRPAAAAR